MPNRKRQMKPKNSQDFLDLLASHEIEEVAIPPGVAYRYTDEDGDIFFVVDQGKGYEFRTGYVKLHDAGFGLVWGFNKTPSTKVIETLRRGGGFLLRAVKHVGVGIVAERFGIKLSPARNILEKVAGATENDIIKLIVETYGQEYVKSVVRKVDLATDPQSPGGVKITKEEAAWIGNEILGEYLEKKDGGDG